MSAPIGFSSQGLRGVIARDFALLTPLGVGNLDGVKWFYDKAWLIFRASRTEPVVRIYARDLPRRRWPRGGFLSQDSRGGAHDIAAWHPLFFHTPGVGVK